MKIATSLPDEVFEAAERAAKKTVYFAASFMRMPLENLSSVMDETALPKHSMKFTHLLNQTWTNLLKICSGIPFPRKIGDKTRRGLVGQLTRIRGFNAWIP